jgi:hypothetical protein
MTYGILRRSIGEQRLLEFMRLCDLVIFLGIGSTAAGGFVWNSPRVMGFGFGFIATGAIVKLAGVIITYLLMSSRRPPSEIPIWIRRWTRTSSVFGALTALYVLVAHPNVAVEIAAGFAALLCALLFMRVDVKTRGEWDMAAGPSWDEMASPIARLGPAWGWELNIWLTGICLAGTVVLRAVMPDAFKEPPHIIAQYDLKARVQRVYYAEQRYYQTNRRYSSDLVEIHPLALPFMDSLVPVTITIDARGYRAVARHPYDSSSCGLWGGSALSSVKLEGVGEGQAVCWPREKRR